MADSTNVTSIRQRIFTVFGWLGFLSIVPLVLKSVGVPQLSDALAGLGIYGSPGFLLIYFYFFPLLDLLFGTDRHFSPMLVGIIASFLFFAMVVPMGFMSWYQSMFTGVQLSSFGLAVLVFGVFAMVLGILLSYVKKGVNGFLQVLLIVFLPAGLFALGAFMHIEQILPKNYPL